MTWARRLPVYGKWRRGIPSAASRIPVWEPAPDAGGGHFPGKAGVPPRPGRPVCPRIERCGSWQVSRIPRQGGKRRTTWECYIRMTGFPTYFFLINGAAHGAPCGERVLAACWRRREELFCLSGRAWRRKSGGMACLLFLDGPFFPGSGDQKHACKDQQDGEDFHPSEVVHAPHHRHG